MAVFSDTWLDTSGLPGDDAPEGPVCRVAHRQGDMAKRSGQKRLTVS